MKFLGGDGGQVVDRLVGSFVVEPVGVVQGLELDVLDVAPGSLGADEFGSTPASMRRSVNAKETYWLPASV